MNKQTTAVPVSPNKQALRDWAMRNKLSTKSIAQATGYSYQHVWNLLYGSTEPTDETLGRIVANFGPARTRSVAQAFYQNRQQVVAV